MEIKLPGYCYRISEDVEVILSKKTVQDELTMEEVVKKEINCTKAEVCGMAAESCPVVEQIINQHRGK